MFYQYPQFELLDEIVCLITFGTVFGRWPVLVKAAARRTLFMQWNRSNAIGLSKTSCLQCHGLGVRIVHKTKEVPCNCVYRAIFAPATTGFGNMYTREREPARSPWISAVGGTAVARFPGSGKSTWPIFCLVSRRFLDEFE